MDIKSSRMVLEVDAEDIQHLMNKGVTTVHESAKVDNTKIDVEVKCGDYLTFEVNNPGAESEQ